MINIIKSVHRSE